MTNASRTEDAIVNNLFFLIGFTSLIFLFQNAAVVPPKVNDSVCIYYKFSPIVTSSSWTDSSGVPKISLIILQMYIFWSTQKDIAKEYSNEAFGINRSVGKSSILYE